ncbi:helix-turn-helix domain-containing protein [Paenibacillus sp. GCM10012307]|uniref:Helix-turn-helix domain-containing protein n=1 Tax=Paenibacillus roseus TaxID=2798579 RepID=A0A934J6K4_9BACL|nr:helix-turn-helix domain-containing protein [Paenibacillus roseus]MBJ6362553.1 helix-turn-helix domain-containing protein [Paenibacillus roseus]
MIRTGLPFQTHLFTLLRIEVERYPAAPKPKKMYLTDYMLLSILQGNGIVYIDGKRFRLSKGCCFLIHPGSMVEVANTVLQELELYKLIFRAEQTEAAANASRDSQGTEGFLLSGKLNVQPLPEWSALLKDMYTHRENTDNLAAFKQHIRLQELLHYLCARNLHVSGRDPRRAVIRTIDELHGDITRNMSIKLLAEQANMGSRQYTYLFKELTGVTPSDYVTELRINQAKTQLLSSNDQVSTIARNAGFQDVYYFSRRFKQMVGLSPKHFISERRRELRVVALYYGGILTAMGVKPVGANLTWWGGSEFLKDMETEIVNVGEDPSMELLASLEPDLILMNTYNARGYEQYAKIAPSVLIPYDGRRGIYEETRLVGGLINHSKDAEDFIQRYEKKAAAARARIQAAGINVETKTASILRIEAGGSQFSIFGENYGRCGWPIYRGLRFKPSPSVQHMMASGIQIEQRIPTPLLPDYVSDSDYLFVINEGEGVEQFAGVDLWELLSPVQHNRMFELPMNKFLYFDPISLEAQLELLTEMVLERGL